MIGDQYNDTLLFEEPKEKIFGEEFIRVVPENWCLRRQREALNLTQKTVAEKAGIDIRQYQRLEAGECSMSSTSLRIGLAICDVLKLDPHRFVPLRPEENEAGQERG